MDASLTAMFVWKIPPCDLCQGKAGEGQGGREPSCPGPWGGALDEVEWHPDPPCELWKTSLELRKGCATGPRSDSSSSSWRAPQHCCLSSFPWQVSGNILWQQEDNSHLTDLWKFSKHGRPVFAQTYYIRPRTYVMTYFKMLFCQNKGSRWQQRVTWRCWSGSQYIGW